MNTSSDKGILKENALGMENSEHQNFFGGI